MGYYAEIIKGKVAQVLVVDGTEVEAIAWLVAHVSSNEWVKTDIDGGVRNKYAGIGDEYHTDIDKFVSRKPFSNWELDKDLGMYLPPLPKPIAIVVGYVWKWSQDIGSWISTKIERI